MANHIQLSCLTDDQRADFALGKGRINAEFWVISWPTTLADGSPSGDEETVYSFSNWLADSKYTTPLTTWLDGRPLIPAFVPSQPTQTMHDITRTLALNDNTVTLEMDNTGRVIESLIYKHGSGVKAECFWFFPLVDGGTAISQFLGQLKTPQGEGSINRKFVTLTAVSGLGSANIQIPNFAFPQQCSVRYPPGPGVVMTLDERRGHPCTYNRDLSSGDQTALGGAKGLLNGAGAAFPTCPHTEQACVDRFGHKLVYMGQKTVIVTVPVGEGEHHTYSATHGRFGSLTEPVSVIYGERDVTAVLVDWRNEVNPGGPSVADAGTKVTLWVGGIGPVEAISDVQLNEATPQGLDYRLGTDEQTPTVFTITPPTQSLNRRVVINANKNPTNPVEIQLEQLKLTFHCKGRNTVRVYSDEDTYTLEYTNNRAWCLLELLESTWYGLRLDRRRLVMDDFIYLAGKNVSFNCQVTARTAQTQISDIVQAARWYPPFHNHDSVTGKSLWRWMPIEELDLEAGDIPTFSDDPTNPARNIVLIRDGDALLSTVTPYYNDPGEIANDVYLQFEDGDHKNIARPLHFPDWTAQARAGRVYGDNSKLPISKSYDAYGITNLSEAVPLGAFFRDLGRYWLDGEGGLANNLLVPFVTRPSLWPEAMELHPGKAIFIDSANLDPSIYVDPNGDPFAAFIVKKLHRTNEGDLIVLCVAYGKAFYDGLCSPSSGYVQWTHNAATIDGEFGTDTEMLTVPGTLGSTGVTWDSPITAPDIVVDRWVHTIKELPAANSYNVWFIPDELGFKIWSDGSIWQYRQGGIDTYPAGTVQAGDTVGQEFDANGGSPLRRWKINGVTIHTDISSVMALNAIEATGFVTSGMTIGPVFWEAFPCAPGDEQDPGSSGGSTVIMPTEDGTLIGDELIGDPLAG